MRRVVSGCALLLFAGLMSGCSSGTPTHGQPGSLPPSSGESQNAAGSSTTSSTIPQSTFANTWNVKTVDSSGASWTTTISVGNLITGANIASKVSASLLAACSVDSRTDAVVPYRILTTSTTQGGFAAAGNQALTIVTSALGPTAVGQVGLVSQGTESNTGYSAGEALFAGGAFSSGPTCPNVDPNGNSDPSSQTNQVIVGGESLKNGSSVQLNGFFQLKNWAYPAMPNGDSSWFPNIWILIPSVGAFSIGNDWETTSVTGPAVIHLLGFTPNGTYDASHALGGSGDSGYGWAFPLDGMGTPDCADANAYPPYGHQQSIQALCQQQ
jgi:hypothetical protein